MRERVTQRLGRTRAELQARDRRLSIACDLPDETGVGRQLVVVGEEVFAFRLIFERVQEHRLSDTAEPPHDHALLGRSTLEPPDQDLELAELAVSSSKFRWSGPSVWCEGVRDRVDGGVIASYAVLCGSCHKLS